MILMLVIGALDASAQTVIPVKVDQYPPLQVVADNVQVEIPEGGITMGSDVSIDGGDGTYAYLWTNAKGEQLSTQKTFTIMRPGDYFLQVTDGHGCQVSVKFTATGTVGIEPVNMQDVSEIRLLDTAGRLLAKSQGHRTAIDRLPAGSYILCLVCTDGNERIRKIIVK